MDYFGLFFGLVQLGPLVFQLDGDGLQLGLDVLESGAEIFLYILGLLHFPLPRLDLKSGGKYFKIRLELSMSDDSIDWFFQFSPFILHIFLVVASEKVEVELSKPMC